MSHRHETPAEALARIEMGFSPNDIAAVYYFAQCGIAADQINPRENVLTAKAWKAKGRRVARGTRQFPICVWIPSKRKDENGNPQMFPKKSGLFHISQTVAADAPKGTEPECVGNLYLHDPDKSHADQRAERAEACHEAGKAKAAEMRDIAETDNGEELKPGKPEPAAKQTPEPATGYAATAAAIISAVAPVASAAADAVPADCLF